MFIQYLKKKKGGGRITNKQQYKSIHVVLGKIYGGGGGVQKGQNFKSSNELRVDFLQQTPKVLKILNLLDALQMVIPEFPGKVFFIFRLFFLAPGCLLLVFLSDV